MVIELNQADIRDAFQSQLCVPDDNLEDVEFFPNFLDDLIQLSACVDPFDEIDGPLDGVYCEEDLWKAYEPETKDSREYSQEREFEGVYGCVYGQKIKGKASRKRSRKSGLSISRRRCSHCQAEKTPQWRAGPNGPRSLCNACGVRYKSGRLLPEYRPVASPSFDSKKHSNFHRKIVEKKQVNGVI
ncbi:GATA transcription factor 4 [Striga hermonthica]|uniref:GATA transcription factor 4 n=1 Tax=Striga hermonthica TaxID=68872 RepID=A0A9N7NW81_STRHE|nr:GATA transcription factor 4 [Striga hermonthica]